MKTVSAIALLVLVTGAAGVVGWWLRDAQLGTSEPAAVPERSEPGRTDDPPQACCGTESLVDVIERAVKAGRNLEARRQLRVLLDAEPRNSWALITLADIYLDEGRTDDAIATLLLVLDYPDDFSVVDAVQRTLDDAVQRHVELLDAPRIPSFYEYMTARLPADDRYRLAHANALAAIGDFEAARYVLDRIGNNGVTAQQVDTLRSALDTIKDLPIRREGQRILASPDIAGRRVELLVDTGATRTALNASALNPERAHHQRGGCVAFRLSLRDR